MLIFIPLIAVDKEGRVPDLLSFGRTCQSNLAKCISIRCLQSRSVSSWFIHLGLHESQVCPVPPFGAWLKASCLEQVHKSDESKINGVLVKTSQRKLLLCEYKDSFRQFKSTRCMLKNMCFQKKCCGLIPSVTTISLTKRNVAIISSHFSMAPLFKSSLSCAVLPLFNGPWRLCPVASWWPCVAVAAAGRAELLTGPTLACACAQAKSRTALDADVVASPQSAKLKRHHSVAKERTEIWWDLMRISHWLIDMSSHTGDKYCYTVTRRHRDAYLIWQESQKKTEWYSTEGTAAPDLDAGCSPMIFGQAWSLGRHTAYWGPSHASQPGFGFKEPRLIEGTNWTEAHIILQQRWVAIQKRHSIIRRDEGYKAHVAQQGCTELTSKMQIPKIILYNILDTASNDTL